MEIVKAHYSSSSSSFSCSCRGTFHDSLGSFNRRTRQRPPPMYRHHHLLPYRARVGLSNKLVLCKVKSDDSYGVTSRGLAMVPSTTLAAEREEARAILSLFLTKQGMSNAAAAETIDRSDQFVDHLVSKLHCLGGGRELTTLEMRDVLVPYMKSLLEEYGDVLIDVVGKFPNHHPSGKKRAVAERPVGHSLKNERAIAHASGRGSDGLLPMQILYLIDIGLNMDQIKSMARRQPFIAYCSLERNVKPVVEFLLDVGLAHKDIPTVLTKCPSLCLLRIHKNLLPKMALLEGLGMDKEQWAKVIYRYPGMLTFSKQKIKAIVDYLHELDISDKVIGKILTRFPNLVGCHVDMKLRPTEEYFQSLGIDAAAVMRQSPQTFGLSLEGSIKPITQFFFDKGFAIEEVRNMISKFGNLYTLSLAKNLTPKWEFFVTMDYPRSELVKCPQFFGYSLKKRIKPRYNRVGEHKVQLKLGTWLHASDHEFERMLRKEMELDV